MSKGYGPEEVSRKQIVGPLELEVEREDMEMDTMDTKGQEELHEKMLHHGGGPQMDYIAVTTAMASVFQGMFHRMPQFTPNFQQPQPQLPTQPQGSMKRHYKDMKDAKGTYVEWGIRIH